MYADDADFKCKLCVSPCKTCRGYVNCTTCETGYEFLYNDYCYVDCPAGTVESYGV